MMIMNDVRDLLLVASATESELEKATSLVVPASEFLCHGALMTVRVPLCVCECVSAVSLVTVLLL